MNLLSTAINNFDVKKVKELLSIDNVDPSANDNEAIRLAAMGHTEIVKLLLADKRVDPSANNNQAIIRASRTGRSTCVKLLLADKRVDPSANDNEALCSAAKMGRNTETVKLLLADIRVDPSVNDNEALRLAAQMGHTKIVKLLLPHLKIHGIPLRNIITEDSIGKILIHPDINLELLINQPVTFLRTLPDTELLASPVVICALNILDVHQKVKKSEKAWTKKTETSMSVRMLNLADITYQKSREIYKDVYEQYVTKKGSEIEALAKIEKKIRGLILDKIASDESNHTITDFIENNRKDLINGGNEVLMGQARIYFNSKQNENHIAWRGYDKFADVKGIWPNLLTPPQNSSALVFSAGVEEGRLQIPATEASLDCRRRVAHYYLSLQDTGREFTIDQSARERIFIGQLAEIRRAHNFSDTATTDDPSCYPGTVGRIAFMGAGHPDLNVVDPIKEISSIVQSMLQKNLSEYLQDKDPDMKVKAWWALIALTQVTIKDVLQGEKIKYENIPDKEWVKLRQDILDLLGTVDSVFDKINKELFLRTPKFPQLSLDEKVYVEQQIVDINYNSVGLNVADKYKPVLLLTQKQIPKTKVEDPFGVNQIEVELEKIKNSINMNPNTKSMQIRMAKSRLKMAAKENMIFEIIFNIIKNNETAMKTSMHNIDEMTLLMKIISEQQYKIIGSDDEGPEVAFEKWNSQPHILQNTWEDAIRSYVDEYDYIPANEILTAILENIVDKQLKQLSERKYNKI